MAKLTRFEKSQKAHYSLHLKHIANSIGNPYADFKADYHNDVATIQRHAKKLSLVVSVKFFIDTTNNVYLLQSKSQ